MDEADTIAIDADGPPGGGWREDLRFFLGAYVGALVFFLAYLG